MVLGDVLKYFIVCFEKRNITFFKCYVGNLLRPKLRNVETFQHTYQYHTRCTEYGAYSLGVHSTLTNQFSPYVLINP